MFLGSFAYLCLFRRSVSMDPDEGIILQGAERILHGQVLYRDFFSYFTPGSYYLYALLFKAFGSSVIVARTVLAVYGGLFSVFTYLMARRVCTRGFALLAAYLVTMTCLPWRFLALHNWDSTLWACAAVYCGVRFFEFNRAAWILGAGSFASLAFLFEQSKGGGLVLGMGLGFAILALLDRKQDQFGWKQWALLAAGWTWPFALTFSYFAAQHALPIMISDWLWPVHHYAGVNSVPYGFQKWSGILATNPLRPAALFGEIVAILAMLPSLIIPALPIVAILLGVYWTVERRRQRLESGKAAYYIFTCCTLAGLLLSVVIGRADVIHFAYLVPLYYLVLVWILEGKDIRRRTESSFWYLIRIAVLLTFTATGLAFLTLSRGARVPLVTRRGTLRVQREDSVVKFTLANVPAGSKIFVYPYLPVYYFLTATLSPTRFDYLQPGMHTHAQEEEAIQEISADRTPVVLFELGFEEKIPDSWPNTPIRYVSDAPVADYLTSEYRSCKVLDSAGGRRFLYMVRRDLGCPASGSEPESGPTHRR